MSNALSNQPTNQFGIVPREYHRTRPRWYHSHIIDWMMANPGGKLEDCAKAVNRSTGTLSAIIRSDMFQAALAHRKQQYSATQDLLLTKKITEVAMASLDTILGVLETKKGAIPLETLNTVADGALKRLGYGVEKLPAPVQLNVQNNNTTINAPVTTSELEAARSLMQSHQQRIASQPAIDAEFSEVKGAASVNGPGGS